MGDVEWDEAKRVRNLVDHKVDFKVAALIFLGPFIESLDRREDYGETRYRALGHVDDEFYLIAYTWRDGRRRIIGAWKVDDDGKRRYQAVLARKS